uniref:Uncharacterized protein n=1 Tax=Gasterosteus aculeatus TaxID=69293 RepID=G3PNA2_GASAC
MSFTSNIVNIHRTILHVLALYLGGGEILVYFTRTPQKEERRRRRGGGGVKLPFQSCVVILSLVESSVLVDRPFFILLSDTGHEDQSFLSL